MKTKSKKRKTTKRSSSYQSNNRKPKKRPRKKDPTSTLTIRRAANRQIAARFGRIRRAIVETVTNPVYGLFTDDSTTTNLVVTNATLPAEGRFQFTRDAEKVAEFNVYIGELVDEELLDLNGGDLSANFLNENVGKAYSRGAVKTRLAAERNLPQLLKLPNYNPFALSQHLDRAELIYTRTFDDLKGIGEVTSRQISRVLADGMAQGKNPKVIARDMADRVNRIGITRARLLARTEIVESHNEAGIREAELVEEDTGVEIKMQWFTALDGRQRDTHEDRHEKIYSKSKARELIGEPNCRCSVSPVFDV